MASSTETVTSTLHVTLIGGTGRTGGWVLEELLQRGHKVKLLARNPDKLSNYKDNYKYKDQLSIVQGDATDESAYVDTNLLQDVNVVLCTVGSPNNQTLVVEATAKALVASINLLNKKEESGEHTNTNTSTIPRIIWMTSIGVNEAIPQANKYALVGNNSSWTWLFGGYNLFGLLVMKVLIPYVIGQDLWDDMGLSEKVIRQEEEIQKRTVIVRPTNMHPVSEHATFSEKWRAEGGENTNYLCRSAQDPPPGKWMNRRTIACALCDLVSDTSRDGTAVSIFQDGKP